MDAERLLAGLVERCHRYAVPGLLAGLALAVLAGFYVAHHLSLNSETDELFAANLPWRQRAVELKADFPQFQNLVVMVIDAKEPEEAEATAAALADALAADKAELQLVRYPAGSPFFHREGLLFLDSGKLEATLDRIIDAQPFLGELAQDPSARGLFGALALLARGVEQGTDLTPYRTALTAFHEAIAGSLAGHPQPLSWTRLLAGDLADAAGPYTFVLAQPRLDHAQLEPGGAAIRAIRYAASRLEFVKSGDARVRITGSVALADEEFATVARGAVQGMIGSIVLITLWLFLAVGSWRLIVPILLTLVLGLTLTLLFAAVAVGTLNLVSVGFGILFVGLAVDFAIQFCVRYREMYSRTPSTAAAMAETGRRAGGQILVAAAATAAGFLSFVPTDFRGVAQLGLIAGGGMLIAFACTLTFLPSAIGAFRPPHAEGEVGFGWAAPLDDIVRRRRRALLLLFGGLAALGVALLPLLTFDSNPLHTKDPTTEAMRTLEDLRESPVASPFSADIMVANAAAAATLAPRLRELPLVDSVQSINTLVPRDQTQKLALIADARELLWVTLAPRDGFVAPQPADIRAAAQKALAQIEPVQAKVPAERMLGVLGDDLRALAAAPDAVLRVTDQMLSRFLPVQLDRLREALSAEPVTLDTVPPDLARDWVLPDGRARIHVTPKPEASASQGLVDFVTEIASIAPDAGGSAPTIVASSRTIVASFRAAMVTALIAITLILFLVLRRPLDVGLVLAPLLLSSLMTATVLALLGLPLNYANVIVLPLLLGVGVSFNIYFVMNWRAGQRVVLGSATARAILFSALTTGTAFGSLALSHHPGTESMGWLLLISLGMTLLASLIFLPALLATLPLPAPQSAIPPGAAEAGDRRSG